MSNMLVASATFAIIAILRWSLYAFHSEPYDLSNIESGTIDVRRIRRGVR
jgi:hypothetical protein